MSPNSRGLLRRVALVATLCVLLTVAGVGSAAAQRVTIKDAQDAPAAIDIRKVTYRNSGTTFKASLVMRDLRWAHTTFDFIFIARRHAPHSLVAETTLHGDHRVTRRWYYFSKKGDIELQCPYRARADVHHDRLTVAVPKRCLRKQTLLDFSRKGPKVSVDGFRSSDASLDLGPATRMHWGR